MSDHGGKRKGAGRPKGATNKATRELQDLAKDYTTDALVTLEQVMKGSDSDAARVSAAKELLDRGYGKAPQSHEHTGSVALTLADLITQSAA